MRALEARREPTAATGPSPSPAPEARPPGRADVDRLERRRRVLGPVLLAVLAAGLAIAAVAAAGMGAYPVPASEVLASVLGRLGLRVGTPPDAMAHAVLWEIRFPRIALAAVVGGSLATAGATMQGTFGNPLAEPGIVGVSSGAVLGAVLQIVVGLGGTGPWSIIVAAFAGGLVTITVVYLAARSDGRTEVVTLILTGIAVNAFTGAVIGLMTYLSDDAELRSITFWTLGSVAQATWPKVGVAALVGVVAVAGAVALARPLDLLALGDAPARHLGVDVESLRRRSLAVVALLTAAAVAVSGVVLFVGLVIPHLVRMVAGPAHRLLIPASALAGALVLVVADLLARTLVAPAELPLGVLTALVGSPFFFWQLRRTRARQGGWA
jgi:iron complex transport system permease protein